MTQSSQFDWIDKILKFKKNRVLKLRAIKAHFEMNEVIKKEGNDQQKQQPSSINILIQQLLEEQNRAVSRKQQNPGKQGSELSPGGEGTDGKKRKSNPLSSLNEAVNILASPADALSLSMDPPSKAKRACYKHNLVPFSLISTINPVTLNRPRWQPREDIFLVGVVLDTYYRRHSLKPTKQERDAALNSNVLPNTLVWKIIHRKFEKACRRYKELTSRTSCPRTIRALQKRWKSKSKIITTDEETELLVPPTKLQEREWDTIYNKDFLLSCCERDFEAKKVNLIREYQQTVFTRDVLIE